MPDTDSPRLTAADLTPDLDDGVPVDDAAEPDDADTDHTGPNDGEAPG